MKKQIVFLDDDIVIVNLAKTILDILSKDVQIHYFTDVLDALDFAEIAHVDGLITDIYMAGTDGIRMATYFKSKNPNIKVLYISGGSTDTLGVEVLLKPFDFSKIVEFIDSA